MSDNTCNFCGLHEEEVEHVFTGKAGVICAECVDLCAEKLAEIRQRRLYTGHEQPAAAR